MYFSALKMHLEEILPINCDASENFCLLLYTDNYCYMYNFYLKTCYNEYKKHTSF